MKYPRLLILTAAIALFFSLGGKTRAATFTVTNTNDSGAGSFRQAIADANGTAGLDTIAFGIGTGARTISPSTSLPAVTDPVIIDGTTQPGFAGTPLIALSGGGITNVFAGLRITAGGSTVKGLSIGNFIGGPALALSTSGGNVVQGNYIGVDATGTQRQSNQVGLSIDTPNNIIGGTDPAQRNVISGSVFENVAIGGAGSNNQIKGNYIGTNAAGTAGLSSGSTAGIGIGNAANINNVIGGTEPGAGNLISGNSTYGVFVRGDGTLIQGNLIGTDVSGNLPIPNGSGVYLSASNVMLGGTVPAARNIISGNNGRGVHYSDGTFTAISKIQGNYIGVNVAGTAVLSNQQSGIEVDGTVQIGGAEPGAGNVISGNSADSGVGGIYLRSSGSFGPTKIEGNYIGTDATGTLVLGNSGGDGIDVSSSGNIIGGGQPGAGNVIGGALVGIRIGVRTSATVQNNTIQGNYIGVSKNGEQALGSLQDGIRGNGLNNKIGGSNPGEGNTIAYSREAGIYLQVNSNAPAGNTITGNSIFRNGRLGIDLGFDGVEANDQCDADSGTNDLQNYPVLTSTVSANGVTTIAGNLNSVANSNYTVDFYASPIRGASGYGEGKIYLGSTPVATNAGCNAQVNFKLTSRNVGGLFITATATNAAGSTSEFSAAVKATGTGGRAAFDFDGDGRSDASIFRPTTGEWWYSRSSNGQVSAARFGTSSDKIVPGDYTGDGRTDIAFFRPSSGFWFILRSEDNSFYSFPFGAAGDVPAPADYDGDGKSDAAVFRPSNATWYILNSGGGTSIVTFGANGDWPVAADYDGDGKTDIAVFRPSDGSWWYLQSTNLQFRVYNFGTSSDKPVPADYTGDGRADVAVFRPASGEWFVQRSEDNSFYSVPFGTAGDIPAPGDYDGDGKFDAAVFRSAGATWFINRTTGGVGIFGFGLPVDRPVPAAFVP